MPGYSPRDRERRALLDALPSAAIYTDPGFCILEANRMAARLFDCDPRDLTQRNFRSLLAEPDSESILCALSTSLDRFEVLWMPGSGQPFVTEATRRAVTDTLGQTLGFLFVLSDPARRRLELLEARERVTESREAERKSLAQDLHDGAVQELIAIGFSLADVQRRLKLKVPELNIEPILRSQNEVLSVARRLRGMVTDLRPAGLEDYGLSASLEGLAAKLARDYAVTNTEVCFELQEIPELRLPEQLCLFRATQEALCNCFKHAQARNITISLNRVGRQAQLTVRDDGVGFEVPADFGDLIRSEHYGLAGIAERVALLKGVLSMRSDPGQGTCLQVCLTPQKA